RFDIEEMFRDFKKGGYNLEDTKVSGERLISIILLISIAYTSATIQGQEIKRKGVQKYVGRIKEYGRTERRHSSFYIGLYGQ
ncbi:MAG: IS4 family transposase, partial [Nostoc sp.]